MNSNKPKLGRPFTSDDNPLSACCNAPTVKRGGFRSKKYGERDRFQCLRAGCGKTFTHPPKTLTNPTNPKESHKVSFKGELNPHSKLSEADVLEILALKSEGMSGREIARKLNAKYPTVMGVIQGRTWTWLTDIKPSTPNRR